MKTLNNVANRRLAFFAFVIYLAITSVGTAKGAPIVFVEAIPTSRTMVSYQMSILFDDGKSRVLASDLAKPIELIQCDRNAIAYIDSDGAVWNLALKGASPTLLAQTAFRPKEEIVGKIVLRKDERIFYAAINSIPESTTTGNNNYEIKKFDFDGHEKIIVKGKGKIYAIHATAPNTFEAVSDSETLVINTVSERIVRNPPSDLKDLKNLSFFNGGYSIFLKEQGSIIQARNSTSGETKFSHKLHSGFGIIKDFDAKNNAALLIVVSQTPGDDRLIEALNSSTERELRRGAVIGAACYVNE